MDPAHASKESTPSYNASGNPLPPQHPSQAAQAQLAHETQKRALSLAKRRSRKPTDKTIPDGVENLILGDGVQQYKALREVERKIDGAMMRKRMDVQDGNGKAGRGARWGTMRIWVSNTVEGQSWQGGANDQSFSFNSGAATEAKWTVKIEGRLLGEEDEESDDDSSDDEEDTKMDTDKKMDPKGTKYPLSHFFKSLKVELVTPSLPSVPSPIEWQKPILPPNTRTLPPTSDFTTLQFTRPGDNSTNIIIRLTRDETPERFTLSPLLADILDTPTATRAEAVTGLWEYVTAHGLQAENDPRAFHCDPALRQIFKSDTGFVPQISDMLGPHLLPLPPVELAYTIRCDQEWFSKETQEATIYDVSVPLDSGLRHALAAFTANPTYASSLREISKLDEDAATIVQALTMSKAKHDLLNAVAVEPVQTLQKWALSQKKDLNVIVGEGGRGTSDLGGEEWRRGGDGGLWQGESVRETVSLLLSSRGRGLGGQ